MSMPFRARLLASIGLPILMITFLIPGASFVRLAAEERRDTVEQFAAEATSVAQRFEALFARAAAEARGNARAMEADLELPVERIVSLLRATVAGAPDVYGAAVAFEPGFRGTSDDLLAPYVYRVDGEIASMNIDADSAYDWARDHQWSWWHAPRSAGAGLWTEAYFDEGAGGVMMVSFGEPFQDAAGRFRGVATVDIAVEALATRVADRLVGDRDFIIVDAEGRLVAAREDRRGIESRRRDRASAPGWGAVQELAGSIEDDGRGVGRIMLPDQAQTNLVGFAPIGTTGWTFAFRMPEREALAPVRRHVMELAAGLLVTLTTILAVIWIMAGRVVRPVLRLRDGVTAVAEGDLDARVEGVERSDEIGQLAVAFNGMTDTLQETLHRLAGEERTRARIERDLDMAREIQRGLLPTGSLDLDGFSVAGWNRPADKTGGDYYDWLPLPDGRAMITLADVTGHGIGPALIVAACRAYVRAAASEGTASLVETLERVNRLLCADVGEGRFVTAAVGVLDPVAATVDLLSAGQAPILFVRGATGEVTTWPATTIPLGIMHPLPSPEVRTIHFEPGDELVLLTDGFFEWADARRELYGLERLAASLQRHRTRMPAEQIARLHADVLGFAGGTPQADDLTAIVIRRD